MSEHEKSTFNANQNCLSLQIDKSTETKTKVCYYLDLPKSERDQHQLSKSERLVLRKKQYNLNQKSERCILDKTKICKKNCRDFEDQDETKINCRNRCKIDEKKPCIQFEDKNDFATTLSVEIKRRPWENYHKCIAQTYQCYCGELKKLINDQKNTGKSNRTGLSDGKALSYQDRLKIKLKDRPEVSGQHLKEFQLNKGALNGQFLKTFQIQCTFPLSLTGRNLLTSFTNKYIYYAIDDILYLLRSNKLERDNLLTMLYSSMLSLHNDFSINFFDIWIDSVYFNEYYRTNRFLNTESQHINQNTITIITLKLHYFTRTPIKKPQPIW